MASGFRAALWAIALLAMLGLAAAGAVTWWLDRPLALASATVELSIEAGASPREVAQGWVDAGIQEPAEALYQWFRWSGQARRIRAGSYAAQPGITPRSLLDMMVQGRETLLSVRLIEGWTLRQVRAALLAAPGVHHRGAAGLRATLRGSLGSVTLET